jgi:hypothetical protein
VEIEYSVLDDKAALEHSHKYNSEVESALPIMVLVKITATKASDCIPHLAFRALRNIDKAVSTQLKSYRDKLHEKNETVVFEMLLDAKIAKDLRSITDMLKAIDPIEPMTIWRTH